jgi:hypothetical protein
MSSPTGEPATGGFQGFSDVRRETQLVLPILSSSLVRQVAWGKRAGSADALIAQNDLRPIGDELRASGKIRGTQ